jgi:hypothetical protein
VEQLEDDKMKLQERLLEVLDLGKKENCLEKTINVMWKIMHIICPIRK